MVKGVIRTMPYRKICVECKKWHVNAATGRRYYEICRFHFDDWKHCALALKKYHLAGFVDFRVEIITILDVRMYEEE